MGAALRRSIPAISAGGLVAVTAVVVSVLGVDFAQAAPKSDDGQRYTAIEEVFTTPVGRCDEDGTTIEMTNCVLIQVVRTDQRIDVLQKQRFTYAVTAEDRERYRKDDARWLEQRQAAVRKIDTGGSLDAVLQAQKTLELSQERLAALQ